MTPIPAHGAGSGRGRRAVLALFLGALAALVLAELGLRGAGWAWARFSGRARGAAGEGALLLCCGDSNVFGIFEAAASAWPARLQARLDRCEVPGTHRVVNLGVPGLNSQQLAAILPAEIERLRPAAVLITIGANNAWGWVPEVSILSKEAGAAAPPWYERLRLVRLARLVATRVGGPEPAAGAPDAGPPDAWTAELGNGNGKAITWSDREGLELRIAGAEGSGFDGGGLDVLKSDLAGIQTLLAARGIPLLLVGYASEHGMYAAPNAILREVARERGLPFVDVSPEAEALALEHGRTAVFYADLHPKGPGYELTARLVHAELARLGLAAAPADADEALELPTAAGRLSLAGTLHGAVGTDEELAFVIDGELPGRAFRIVLLTPPEHPGDPIDATAIARDPLYLATSQFSELAGELDQAGHARVPIGRLLKDPGRRAGSRVCAVYLLQRRGDPLSLLRLGDPLEAVLD